MAIFRQAYQGFFLYLKQTLISSHLILKMYISFHYLLLIKNEYFVRIMRVGRSLKIFLINIIFLYK